MIKQNASQRRTDNQKRSAITERPTATPVELDNTAIRQRYSKRAIVKHLAVHSALNQAQITGVLNELARLISRHIKKHSVGEFQLAGLFKITIAQRPAKNARQAKNPFTGKMITFKAKPATAVVKIQPLKGLKDMLK